MKYLVLLDVPPEEGNELERAPDFPKNIQDLAERHKLQPLYFAVDRRLLCGVIDTEDPNVLAGFTIEVSHLLNTYPEIIPVVGAEEFPALAKGISQLISSGS